MKPRATATTTTAEPVPGGYGPLTLTDGLKALGGHLWGVQRAADRPWAIQEVGNRLRFEVRPGDYALAADAPDRNRAELSCKTNMLRGVPWVFSRQVYIEPAPASLSGEYKILSQVHQVDGGDSPPWACEIAPATDDLRYRRRWQAADGSDQQHIDGVTLAGSPGKLRGRWVHMLTRHIFDGLEGRPGVIQHWVDKAPAVDLHDVPTDYLDPDGPYWKLGVYRREVSAPTVVHYANVELGGDELLCRIATPLPI